MKKAQEEYDDAIAHGNLATLFEESKETEMYLLKLGNVLP